MAEPGFSVSEITTFHQTFEQDLATYAEAGAEGVGVWEFKLDDHGDDADAVARLKDSGLKATTCIPGDAVHLPRPVPGPDDPEERTAGALRRDPAFRPLRARGDPLPSPVIRAREPTPSRRGASSSTGCATARRSRPSTGSRSASSRCTAKVYGHWSMIGTIPETIDLMDEIGEPNVKLLYDVYHLWDTDDVIEHTVKHGSRISPSVHICDWRDPTRNDFDRALPGDGLIDLPAIFGALEAGDAIKWVDLEIFSDDGSFSDQDFEDSLWKQDPLDVCRRGKAGFEKAWAARKAPS